MTSDETANAASDLVVFTGEIVSAYVSHNPISTHDLPTLISSVHAALKTLGAAAPVEAMPELKPAIAIKKSVTPDFIICLEDGKKFKSLKRHLMTHFQMTPDDYRAKWGLPDDYPMVAPSYAAVRSTLAKSNGLGRKPAATPPSRGKKAPPTA
ncbi:putative transcriptional regulator [Devosia sp. UYZn731]|uniref:MucR family transcriptional regulator n=1 Tax=Devosia sp. UYZn731 TaxID=3156345 RepID=UPI003390D9A1